MTDGDGPAINIQLFRIYSQAVAAVDHLHCKSLVQFPEADIIHLQAGALEQLGHREDGTDAHFVRITTRNLKSAKHQLVGHTQLIGALAGHQQSGRSAVGKLRGVAGRHGALAAVRIKVRLQREQAFQRGVGPIALVVVAADLPRPNLLASFLIEERHRDLHGRDLALEKTFSLSASSALLAQQCVLVLHLPAHLVALGDDFRSVTHAHVQPGQSFLQFRVRIAGSRRHADTLDAAANRRLHALADDLVRGHSNRLQSRRAKPVYGRARDRSGKAGQHGGSAGDVVTLRTVWLCTSQHNVVYFGRVKLRHLAQDVLDAMCCQIFGAGYVERTAERFRQPGP